MSKLLRIFDKFFPQSHAGLRQKKREGITAGAFRNPKGTSGISAGRQEGLHIYADVRKGMAAH